jgi:C1A family cysteine protease
MEEIVYGYIPSIIDGTEHTLDEKTYESLPIPSEYSYLPYMSKILNQGSESTCVPHSITAVYDYYYAMKNPDTSEKGKFKHLDLAIHQIYNCRTNRGEGMTFKEALNFCRDHGVISEKDYLKGKEGSPLKILDYARILDMNTMKKSLIINGPCLIATYVKDPNRPDFWNGNYNYGGHATSIIGYNDNKQAFLLRNSWGTAWANNGYTWLPYRDFNKILEIWAVLA